MKPRQCFTASRRRVLGKGVWMRLWRSGVPPRHHRTAVVGSPVNHGDQAPPRVGRLCPNHSVASRTALVRVAMKCVHLVERNESPRPLDTDFAAGLGGRDHGERLPREADPARARSDTVREETAGPAWISAVLFWPQVHLLSQTSTLSLASRLGLVLPSFARNRRSKSRHYDYQPLKPFLGLGQ